MSTIVTRAGKGSPLTNTEVDANFTNLNTDKLETSAIGTLVPSITGYNNSNWDTAYGWGNHASSGYLTSSTATSSYQPLDGDLTSIAGVAGTSGFLKKTAANTWSLDTSTYLTSYTETDPVFVASAAYNITSTNISNWNTAYGWGNHASAGYLTTSSASSTYLSQSNAATTYQPLDGDLTSIAGLAGTSGFLKKTAANTWSLDTNTYLTGIDSSAVTTALGYTPYNATNPSGYISGITGTLVTTALGYTPYNATNPNGYTSNTGTVTGVTGTAPVVSSGGETPVISMAAATTSANGYLTSTDWNTFNNKTSNTGTVTSVAGTGTVNGITLTGSVASSGNLTLGGTLSNVSLTTQVTGTLPIANGGTGQTTLAAASIVTYTGTQTLTNKTLTDPAIIGTILEDVFTITDANPFQIDPGNGSIQLITIGGNRTPTAANFASGEAITLMVDDGSAFAITWTSATFGGSGVIWETDSGSAPTLSTTGYTTIVLWKVASQVYGARVGNA